MIKRERERRKKATQKAENKQWVGNRRSQHVMNLFCSKIHWVSPKCHGHWRAERGDVLCFPKWLRFGVPRNPVVVSAGGWGPRGRSRGDRHSGNDPLPWDPQTTQECHRRRSWEGGREVGRRGEETGGAEGRSGSPQGFNFDHEITAQEPSEKNAHLKGWCPWCLSLSGCT